jgi:small subunit ribosomal protein S6
MPQYECVFIARQDISSSQVEGLIGQFSNIVEESGGKVANTEMWGLRNLAYRIKKNRKGHYVMLNLDAPSAAVQEMERNMRLNEDVIRYLTIRVNELEAGPSIVMQARHSRDERGGRGGRDERGGRGGRGGPRGESRGGGAGRHDAGPKAAEQPRAEGEKKETQAAEPKAKPDAEPKAKPDAEPEAKPDESAAPEQDEKETGA